MKSVLVLTGFGLAVVAMLACRSSTPPPSAPAPSWRPEPPPTVEIVEKIEPESPEGRVLTREESRQLILKGQLDVTEEPEQVIEYATMTRAGPARHLKVKLQAPAPEAAAPFFRPGPPEHRFYSRAGILKNRPVKTGVPVAKQD